MSAEKTTFCSAALRPGLQQNCSQPTLSPFSGCDEANGPETRSFLCESMPSQARVPRRRCRVPGQFPCASPKPKAQILSPAPAAPPRQPRLMIHSCGSEAVNHRSPSPSCESPAVLTRVVIYLRRAVQSGSPGAVSGKRLRLKCYTVSLSGTRDRHWWQPKGCCGPPSPEGAAAPG